MKKLLAILLVLITLLTVGCSASDPLTEDLYSDAGIHADSGTFNTLSADDAMLGTVRPKRDNATDLGSASLAWRQGYFHELFTDSGTIYIGGVPLLEYLASENLTGAPGAPGEDGYTPIKGVDYFDGEKGDKGDPGDVGSITSENITTALGYIPASTDNITDAMSSHNATYLHTDIALNTTDRHSHANKAVLDQITAAFTTTLQNTYDTCAGAFTAAYKTTLDTFMSTINSWKMAVDNHLVNTSNPHSVTKAQVGLTNVTDDAQITKSIIDAKGDIITATAADTPARLASSAVNNNVLTVDTITATGLKWAAPAGGNDPRIFVDAVNGGEQHDVTASTALTKVTVIDMPLTAGTYVFQYYVTYRSNQLTNGIRLAVNYSGTNGAFVWNTRWSDLSALASTAVPDQDNIGAAGHVGGTFASRAKSSTTRGTTLSVDTINADMLIIIEGVFIATGSGNLELWHGSELATAAYTTSVMPGTSVIVTKIK